MLSSEEKKELIEMAHSISFREDMRQVERQRHNPFIANGKLDLNKFLTFLTEFNQFVNHKARPFLKIIDRDMRL